jgi:glutamate---cysteine ligase / carboxylate-amine ligase
LLKVAREPAYSVGIEEEYFVFHAGTRRAVTRRDKTFFDAAKRRLGNRVVAEMLQAQIEVITPPCEPLSEIRAHLVHFRQALAEEAGRRELGIAAVGTFPLAYWRAQEHTPKARYDAIMDDLQMLGLRDMLCGMHVHVEVADPSRRIALMQRVTPYLPLLLALSTSSPFWEGQFSGLRGYRLAAYDELPRTGLPAALHTEAEYRDYVAALVGAGMISDASHVWWALRPSLKHPTLELRVTDVCTRIDDAIAIAALFRCLLHALERQDPPPAELDGVGRALTAENKWRAQRYGVEASLVEPFRREPITMARWLEEVLSAIRPSIAAFGCACQIARLRRIVTQGTSADAQIALYHAALAAGRPRPVALRDVVDWAAAETLKG